MTEDAPEAYDGWDVAAVFSLILGIGALILLFTLPRMSIGFAIATAAGAVILALATATASRRRNRSIPLMARVGSIAGAASLALLLIWEVARQ